ncbi:MAG TPA: glycine zipper 2TM domain-containing protein [Steroidobacteraceae bacterium]
MTSRKTLLLLPMALAVLAFAACGKKPAEETAVTTDPAVQAEIDESAELKAREEELARREAELALKEKEKELADREAALAKASAPKSAPRRAASPSSPAPKPAPVPIAAGPKNYTVPAGTSVSVQLPGELSTKTAQVGQRFTANLTSDLIVDGRVLARAGAPVQGSITEVISGSKTIGGKPTLGLTFDNMTFTGGDKPINGRLTQVAAKSDKARDTAKIAGGAVAGGVIGHQIDSDQGKIVGAVLGALAGTAAAKKTGQEVVLPAGTVMGFTLDSPVTVTQ